MSRAGLDLARAVAGTYSDNPNVRAVMVGGSIARGCADEFSDVEIGVFWRTLPSDMERMEAVSRMGGEIWKFEPFRDGRAGEHVGLSESTVGSERYRGTAMVSPIHLTLEAAEERIGALIDGLDTASRNYEFAAAVRYGVPLYGDALIEEWKKRVGAFPTRLAVKLVQENLWLGPWFNWAGYGERVDHLVVAQHLVWMQQGIVSILAALNREYLPSPEYKWLEWFIDRLRIKPADCAVRLKVTFGKGDLSEAVRELVELGMEVIDLVEDHLPEVNEMSLFEAHSGVDTSWARERWKQEPPYTLLSNIARDECHP